MTATAVTDLGRTAEGRKELPIECWLVGLRIPATTHNSEGRKEGGPANGAEGGTVMAAQCDDAAGLKVPMPVKSMRGDPITYCSNNEENLHIHSLTHWL